ncbi:MAG: hypothetical protein V7K69_15800 [Nostoc sp.]|uniref:hypothetical protein n=1 Tax=Nostoc sp. TaxID=1180 RepID=UPI002FFC2206
MLPKQRIRGVILTPKGLHKLELAKQQTEFNENSNKRFTLINLSVQTGLDSHTLCKIFSCNNKVDRYSLTRCFQAFKILLEPDDYEMATIPLLINSSELQQGETCKDKTLGRQEDKKLGLQLKLDVNEVNLPMTPPEKIRSRGITLLEELSGESLLKAVKFLESLSQESLPLSQNKPEHRNGVAKNMTLN